MFGKSRFLNNRWKLIRPLNSTNTIITSKYNILASSKHSRDFSIFCTFLIITFPIVAYENNTESIAIICFSNVLIKTIEISYHPVCHRQWRHWRFIKSVPSLLRQHIFARRVLLMCRRVFASYGSGQAEMLLSVFFFAFLLQFVEN